MHCSPGGIPRNVEEPMNKIVQDKLVDAFSPDPEAWQAGRKIFVTLVTSNKSSPPVKEASPSPLVLFSSLSEKPSRRDESLGGPSLSWEPSPMDLT